MGRATSLLAGPLAALFLIPLPAFTQERPPPEPERPRKASDQRADLHGDPLPEGAVERIGTLRWRMGYWVTGIRFLPDGKTIATAQIGGRIRYWDRDDGRLVREVRCPSAERGVIHLTPSGEAGVVIGADRSGGLVRVIDAAGGKTIHGLSLDVKEIEETGPSPDVSRVIVRSLLPKDREEDGREGEDESGEFPQVLDIFEIETGKRIRRVPVFSMGYDMGFRTFHVDADASRLAVASPDGDLRVIEVGSGREVFRVPFDEEVPPVPRLSPDGRFLTYRDMREGKDRTTIVDLASGSEVARLTGHGEIVVAFSDDATILATSAPDSVLRIRQTRTGALLREIAGVEEAYFLLRGMDDASLRLLPVRISPDNQTIAIGEDELKLHLWDLSSGREIGADDQLDDYLIDLAYSPDGRYLGVCFLHRYGGLAAWDLKTGERLGFLPERGVPAPVFAFSPDGRQIATAGRDVPIRLWDLGTGEPRCEIDGLAPYRLAFSPDGTTLAAAGGRVCFQLFETTTGKPLPPVQGMLGTRTTGVSFGATGDVIYCFLEPLEGAWTVRSWDFPDREERATLRGAPYGRVLRIFERLGGRTVAVVNRFLAVSEGGARKVFFADLQTGEPLLSLGERISGRGNAFATSTDGRYFAGCDKEEAIHIYEVRTMDEVRVFRGHQGWVTSIAFSPDGRRLASAATDTTIMIWDLAPKSGIEGTPGGADPQSDWEARWRDLALGGEKNAAAAYQTFWQIVEAGNKAVPILLHEMTRPPKVDRERVQRLIVQLDDDSFDVRSKADEALRGIGEAAARIIQETLEGDVSPEVRDRLLRIMDQREAFRHSRFPSDSLRQDRAIGILERIGTQEALDALETIKAESPLPQTRGAAAQAVIRLRQRMPVPDPKREKPAPPPAD